MRFLDEQSKAHVLCTISKDRHWDLPKNCEPVKACSNKLSEGGIRNSWWFFIEPEMDHGSVMTDPQGSSPRVRLDVQSPCWMGWSQAVILYNWLWETSMSRRDVFGNSIARHDEMIICRKWGDQQKPKEMREGTKCWMPQKWKFFLKLYLNYLYIKMARESNVGQCIDYQKVWIWHWRVCSLRVENLSHQVAWDIYNNQPSSFPRWRLCQKGSYGDARVRIATIYAMTFALR